jgi:hypothetical protein
MAMVVRYTKGNSLNGVARFYYKMLLVKFNKRHGIVKAKISFSVVTFITLNPPKVSSTIEIRNPLSLLPEIAFDFLANFEMIQPEIGMKN